MAQVYDKKKRQWITVDPSLVGRLVGTNSDRYSRSVPGSFVLGSDSGYNSSGGFGFTIYDSELGFDYDKAPPAIQRDYDDYNREFVNTRDKTTSTTDPLFIDTGPRGSGQRKDVMTLTGAEQVRYNAITNEMQGNLGRWFAQTEGGNYVPKMTGMVDLEQMQGKGGTGTFSNMSNALLAAVQKWYGRGVDGAFEYSPRDIGGGGGGGGRSGPVYVSPDRRTVEDAVKSQLVALVGQSNDTRITELTDKWLAAHKQSWGIRQSGGQDVDPNQITLDLIRAQGDYKRIHTLRTDADDEMRWVSDRRNQLTTLGLTAADAADRGILMAQLGTNLNDIETGQFQNSKGRKDIGLFQRLGQAAQQVAGAL